MRNSFNTLIRFTSCDREWKDFKETLKSPLELDVELVDLIEQLLNAATPENRISSLADLAKSIPVSFPERRIIERLLLEARTTQRHDRLEALIQRTLLLLSNANERQLSKNKSLAAKRGGYLSGEERSRKSKEKQEWVISKAQELLKKGVVSRDISSIIYQNIRVELESRTGGSAINYPGDSVPSTKSIRRWTKSIRKLQS